MNENLLLPRYAAIGPLLFALVMGWAMLQTSRRKGFKWFIVLLGCGTAMIAALVFAYHIAMGHPLKVER